MRLPTDTPVRPILLALVLSIAAGCSSPPVPVGMEASLPGSSWTLERVVRADGSVERGSGDQITFASDGGLVLSSCNACTGSYVVTGDVLTVGEPLGCTKRACAPGAVELERVLGSSATLRREGVYLVAEPLAGDVEQALFVPASR